ncbi:WYL domain-containing protein [Micropruina sonneratiae]|uniref:WYL domain-containing protein n=1 Tax=Micropruina sonneratiae TaxID=2986940 RepID=UPI002227AC1C|nr:WYL domain-containing protein [Micropruina sp. KQZ13P-5]MCW3157951.1 WYL domain-containing protein [Micropruina sp. KQZ13P-5]
MSTSLEQVSRLLALVPYLQARPDADLAATAAAFGVTPRRLLADLEVLWFVGLPGGLPGDLIDIDMDAVQEQGRISLSNADYLSRPMRFTIEEVTSLIVALRAVREVTGGAAGAAVDSALAKLSRVAGAQESRRVGFAVATSESAIRDRLAEAIEARSAVQLSYDGFTRAETTTPVVEPHRLSVRDGYVYLEAWSRDRQAWRTFRLDRIAAVDAAAGGVAERGEPPVFDGGWLEVRPDAAMVTLTVTDQARWIGEYYPVRFVERVERGWRVGLLVADPAWLRGLLLRLGPQVLDVEPAEASSSARAAAEETLALYQSLPAG